MRPARGKHWGQNFLIDHNISRKIAQAALALNANSQQKIVEIGAGTGNLSSALLTAGLSVLAVEKDPHLVKNLQTRFAAEQNLQVVGADILNWQLPAGTQLCVGNLPYSLTTGILLWFNQQNCPHALFMLQQEVAARLVSPPATKNYSRISVLMQLLYEMKILFKVSPTCFRPVPRVYSAVVGFSALATRHFVDAKEIENFAKFTHKLFHLSRKTLAKSAKMQMIEHDPQLAKRRVDSLTPQEIKSIFLKNKQQQRIKS